MLFRQSKKEFNRGVLVMFIVFIWGLLVAFFASALTGWQWLWHLSWNLVPIVAIVIGIIYDTKTSIPYEFRLPEPRVNGVWEELGDDKVFIIKEGGKPFRRQRMGIY